MRKLCLSCSSFKLKRLSFQKKFPILFGAVPITKKNAVKNYPIEISVCKNCGLVQQSEIPGKKIMDKIYTANYYSCPSPLNSGIGVREIEKFYKFFKNCKNAHKKVLEIGSFDGYLLSKLAKFGWDVYGCDPSPMSKKAKKVIGKDRIKQKFFSEKNYSNKIFDVIIFRNLIEHIFDLNAFLQNVNRCLNLGGKIYIDTPNIKATAKVGGFGLFFHQHILYFSIETLSYLLSKNGFEISRYYEGNPNLFVEAIKVNKPKNKFYKEANLQKKQIIKNNKSIRTKIFSFFNKKKINKVVLFGASALSTSIVSLLNPSQIKKIVLILDNDKLKHNKILCGSSIRISNPNKILKINFDIVLIASYFFINEIKKSLKGLGINPSKIKTVI